uniref:SMC5-SMC6 complex localization factor protein 2 isoform X2 n=1 Tax=Geotrypetes seraphini TaxID=260995 RepID=A0A6P8RCI7_GEOSA|nr:SMC5-SMC6 complex localization factor protein 2 isoform X2 [Geotrypetes seraphini]
MNLLTRNQAITNFFKPTQKPDNVLGSPQKGCVNHELVGLPVSGAEQLGKSVKSSSSKSQRKRIPVPSPSRSPIMEAFLKAKIKKQSSSNNFESNCNNCQSSLPLSLEPSQGMKNKIISRLRRDDDRPAKMDSMVSCEYSKNQKIDYKQFEGSRLDSCALLTTPTTDILKGHGRNGIGKNISQHATSMYSLRESYNADYEVQTSMETCQRERRLSSIKQSKLSYNPLEADSASNILSQENGPYLIHRLMQLEATSDGPSPAKQALISQSVESKLFHDKHHKQKGGSSPLTHLNSKGNSGSEGDTHLSLHRKRKRHLMSRNYQSAKRSEEHSSEPYFITSPDILKNKSDFGKNVKKSLGSDILQQVKVADVVTDKCSENQLDCWAHDEGSESCSSLPSSQFLLDSCLKTDSPSADYKENLLEEHLYLSTEVGSKVSLTTYLGRKVINGFAHALSKTCSKPSKETQCMDSFSHDQTATSSHIVGKEISGPVSHKVEDSLQPPESYKEPNMENGSGHGANLIAMTEFSLPAKSNSNLGSLPSEEELSSDSHSSSPTSNFNSYFTKRLRRRLQYSFESEGEKFGYNLDSDEERLKPLEEIMHISRSPAATPESISEVSSQLSYTSTKVLFPAASPVTYVNNLERLLKEKRESERLDELAKELQEDIDQRTRVLSPGEENADESSILTEEYRAFLKKFSVISDAIPDLHPGQEIFHLSDSGKLFSQHTLNLKNYGFNAQTAEEKLLLNLGKAQQLILISQGFINLIYRFAPCPVPILRWLFQIISVQSDCIVSVQILKTLIDVTIINFSTHDSRYKPWTPSLSDIAAVFVNMGVDFKSLFPLQHLQPDFNKEDILAEIQGERETEVVAQSQAFSCIPENNIINIVKFLGFCTAVWPEGYKDHEILLLILLLCKIRLEKQLKQMPLVDFHCLLENLLKNMRDWDAKMPELCLAISKLSTHHHDLLKLVQLVPNSVIRGRHVRKYLSSVIISDLLKENYNVFEESDMQVSQLCKYLVLMKPSALLKKLAAERTAEEKNDISDQTLQELEQEAYYLTYSLLNLVNEVIYSDYRSSQKKYLRTLCHTLEKHVKCDIREDARLLYRTKVKDLVARIYGKWQELLQYIRPDQGKLLHYWEPMPEPQINENLELKTEQTFFNDENQN